MAPGKPGLMDPAAIRALLAAALKPALLPVLAVVTVLPELLSAAPAVVVELLAAELLSAAAGVVVEAELLSAAAGVVAEAELLSAAAGVAIVELLFWATVPVLVWVAVELTEPSEALCLFVVDTSGAATASGTVAASGAGLIITGTLLLVSGGS